MFASDQEDSPEFDFSILDKARIEDLSLGESVEGENGLFKVQKTSKGYYLWWFLNPKEPRIFPTQEILFKFLESI